MNDAGIATVMSVFEERQMKIRIMLSLLCLFNSLNAIADNPCGVKCTRNVVNKMILNNPKLKGPKGDTGATGARGEDARVPEACTTTSGNCIIFVSATKLVGDMVPTGPGVRSAENPYAIANLGTGVDAADAICQIEGDTRVGGVRTWRAWLSGAQAASTRVRYNDNKTYIRRSYELIAGPTQLLLPFGTPANTNAHPNVINGGVINIWTGTDVHGTAEAGNTCNNFTSRLGGVNGRTGQPFFDTGQWTDNGNDSCDTANYIYCVETGE